MIFALKRNGVGGGGRKKLRDMNDLMGISTLLVV